MRPARRWSAPDQHVTAAINDPFYDQPGQVGKEHLQAGVTCRLNGMLHNEPRGRLLTIKFLVEPDLHQAAAPCADSYNIAIIPRHTRHTPVSVSSPH
jgi:hypothetical protein